MKQVLKHIPEGSAKHNMPKCGFGRIKTGKNIREVYWTQRIKYRGRLFIAIGTTEYDMGKNRRPAIFRWVRWWFDKSRGGMIEGSIYLDRYWRIRDVT